MVLFVVSETPSVDVAIVKIAMITEKTDCFDELLDGHVWWANQVKHQRIVMRPHAPTVYGGDQEEGCKLPQAHVPPSSAGC